MWSVIMPLALGSAFSPTLLAATVVLLSGKEHPLKKSLLYLSGTLIPLLVVTIVIHSFARNLIAFGYSIQAYSKGIDFVISLVLFGIGAYVWHRKIHKKPYIPSRSSKVPVKTTHILHAFLLGIIMMSWDFSTFALFIPAEKDIFFWHGSVLAQASAVVVLIFITLLPVTVPIALYLLMGQKMQNLLEPFSAWTNKNSSNLAIVICCVFALFLLWKAAVGVHG